MTTSSRPNARTREASTFRRPYGTRMGRPFAVCRSERVIPRVSLGGAGPQMVEVGQQAPDFTVLSDEGKPVTLSKELGSGPVILSFYVWDFTNVCQGQLCAMRDSMGDLQK